jgi:uncharacterized membrane protein YqhA
MTTVLGLRFLTLVAVAFSAVGALLMFGMGAVTTVQAIGTYAGRGKSSSLSTDAALDATVQVVTALDQFLLALFLVIFASGVFTLWLRTDQSTTRLPAWLTVHSLSDLKVQLVEVIAVILAVLFLKLVLEVTRASDLPWQTLVLPAGVVLLAASVWLIRRSEHTPTTDHRSTSTQ